MKKCYLRTLMLALALTLAPAVYGQETVTPDTNVETKKRAQTGFKFLSTSVDARAAALGGALTAELYGSSVSMFYNPASMARMDGTFHATLSQLQFIAEIDYNIASVAYRPGGGNYGVFGLSITSVDYGDFIGTIRANNEAGFIETGTFSPTALAVGVGYARTFSDRFSAGAHIKYAFQDFGGTFATSTTGGPVSSPSDIVTSESYDQGTIAVDFGIVYATGFRSLVFAMSTRNFSQELTYERENFELPLTFQIGLAMNMIDFTSLNPDDHSLMVHVDAQRPRDFTEHVRFGVEYTFLGIVSLRGGFEQLGVADEQGVSLGGGLKYEASNMRFGANYAWTDFGLFGSVNRFGLQIGF